VCKPSLAGRFWPIVRRHRSHIEAGRSFDYLLRVIRGRREDVPEGRRMAGPVGNHKGKVAAEHHDTIALPDLLDTVVVLFKLNVEPADVLDELIHAREVVVGEFNDGAVSNILASTREVLLVNAREHIYQPRRERLDLVQLICGRIISFLVHDKFIPVDGCVRYFLLGHPHF